MWQPGRRSPAPPSQDTSSYKLRSLWEEDIAAANIFVDTANSYEDSYNTTLWELGNAFIAAAREVVNNHA